MIQFVSHLPRPFILTPALFIGIMFQVASVRALVAQSRTHSTAARSAPKADADVLELNTRVAESNAARTSGDPVAISLASRRLVAVALREMAELRMVEGAFPQAAELYRNSLDLADSTEARADLALAELQEGKLDDAISDADMARATSPLNTMADQVLSRALMQKGDYIRASESLTRLTNAHPDIPTLYSLALCLLATKKQEDKQRALQVFNQMQAIAGDSGSLHVLFGRAYRDAEDMPSAINEFRRAVQIDPKTPHAHYFLGLAQLSLNEWKSTPDAEIEIKKEVDNYPHDYLANYMLGFMASQERRYPDSDHYLTIAAKINPEAPEPPLYMGLNAYAQDESKRAEAMLRKAVILTGKDEARSNYQIRRAYVDLGRILKNSGRTAEAEIFLAKARELQNKTMEQSQQRIASIAQAGGGMVAAVVPLSQQQENEAAPLPQSTADSSAELDAAMLAKSKLTTVQREAAIGREAKLRSILGLAYSDLATSQALVGDYGNALNYYQQSERWDASVPELDKNLGQSAFRVGNYPEAISGLSKALTQSPNSAPMRAMLGMSYFATDRYAEAARTFGPLGISGMTDGETGYAWAASLAHTGDMKRATEVLNAFQSTPRPNEVLLLAGELWTEIGDYPRAVATFSDILRSNPAQRKAHFDSGLAYIRWERWPEATQQFQEELSLYPEDADAQYHLGFVYLQQSRTEDAAKLFEQVVASHPEHANAQYELGKILLDRGKTADAITHFEAAAHLSPNADYMHYQLQAAYRKDGRTAEADHELSIYKQLKAASREHAAAASKGTP
jgi:tetratricopeptide (TPR) repeat protein